MIYFVIPARAGSKGYPGKNQVLFQFTAKQLNEIKTDNKIIVSTDDLKVKEFAKEQNYIIHDRLKYADDNASMKQVMQLIIKDFKMSNDDIIVVLYLTYPGRQPFLIKHLSEVFKKNNYKSLLCKKNIKTHPYLCVDEKGRQIVKHNLYRRQDYPKCYEISHYICIFKVGKLNRLNNNLYNKDTKYFYIDDPIDVDTKEDLDRFLNL